MSYLGGSNKGREKLENIKELLSKKQNTVNSLILNLRTESPGDRKRNFELAFTTGEKFAGVPDFLTAEDMSGMVEERRIDPKMVFSYVQEVYRMCNEL